TRKRPGELSIRLHRLRRLAIAPQRVGVREELRRGRARMLRAFVPGGKGDRMPSLNGRNRRYFDPPGFGPLASLRVLHWAGGLRRTGSGNHAPERRGPEMRP